MKLAYRKSTGKPINDFSSSATEAGLIGNAIRAGIPENDIEVRDVTKEEYDRENQKIIDLGRAGRQAEILRFNNLKKSINDKLVGLGFTLEEVAYLLER